VKTGRIDVLVSVAGVLVAVWGVVGWVQARSTGHGGYGTALGARVVEVDEGGPASSAGLSVGDRIVEVDGSPVGTPWARPQRRHVRVGEVQVLAVETGGGSSTVEVSWAARGPERRRSSMVDFAVTVSFLGFGVWALLASSTGPGLVLAAFGLCYGLANFPAPGLGPLEDALGFVQYDLSLLTTVLLFHFFMVFPRPKTVAGRSVPAWLLYAPTLPFLLLGLAQWAIYPSGVDGYETVMIVTDLLYLALALLALVHTWFTLSPSARRSTGFVLIPWGLLLAIGPLLVLGVVGLAVEGFTPPGAVYLPLLGAAIPGSMALAVVRGARGTAPPRVTPG
jgi:hypothetical protein